jgi:Xaa-Pro aminopeptidase
MSAATPAYPEFDRAEFEARWERARAGMHARGLDALLVTTEANYRYLSGHATLAFMNRARPLFCLLPRDGDPLILAGASESSVARGTSWIGDVRAFTALVEPGVVELVQAVHDRRLTSGRIGCELGLAQRLGMPPNDFRTLQQRLPAAAFVDGGDLLWELRRVKTPAEVAYLRRAAAITSEAVAATLAQVRAGWTERDVYQHAATGVMRLGADRPGYGPVNADARAPDSMTGGPTARRLQAGRMVYMGAGCAYHAYWSDQVRVFAVGRATDHQRRMYAVMHGAFERCFAMMRPGVPVRDVMRTSLAVLEAGGAGPYAGRLGRIGHGTGLDVSEPPSINADDPAVLEAGMVLYLEPNFVTPEGNFLVEDTVLVTEGGCELLSARAPAELPVIP